MLDRIALILVIIGALNWGSIGLFQFDIVGRIFGGQAGIVSRIIGMLFRIPMLAIIGEDGMGVYSTAYSIYNILLMISSSSGMPQHWQISRFGEPSSVLMETPKRFESSFRVSVFGTVSPVSQRDTACRVTWIFSARSSWEKPFFVLSSYKTSFVVMFVPS